MGADTAETLRPRRTRHGGIGGRGYSDSCEGCIMVAMRRPIEPLESEFG